MSTCNAGDPGSIPGSGRSPGRGNGNPLRYSCLENPMDGETYRLQSMVGYSLCSCKELDTTKGLHFSLVVQRVKNPPSMGRPGFNPWVGKIPWRRAWRIPLDRGAWWGRTWGRPWGHTESDRTEQKSTVQHCFTK